LPASKSVVLSGAEPIEGVSVQIVAKTDVGLVRKRNEDYFVVAPQCDLVVLCDGMGGHPGGDLASRMAAEEVERIVAAGGDTDVASGSLDSVAALAPFATLIRSVFAADRRLRAYGDKHPQYQGMGTTLAALQEKNGVLCVVHVGDSRVYRFRDGSLQQVTQDHSYVATLPESARSSFAGIRNILTRAVGVGEDFEVDFTLAAADPTELYLLCTDGLHNFVEEERINEVLTTEEDRTAAIETLIDDAKRGGGGDNITLALAWVEGATPTKAMRLSGVVIEGQSGLQAQLAT
jgi:serine/threonine protein phosphatase PrpC